MGKSYGNFGNFQNKLTGQRNLLLAEVWGNPIFSPQCQTDGLDQPFKKSKN
jgi:hypothetical protein